MREGIHDEFVAALAEYTRTNALTGAPDRDDILFGAVSSVQQLEHVQSFLDRLPDHAAVVAGGHRAAAIEATVVAGLRQNDEKIIQNEIFGSVIIGQSFRDAVQAVR